MHGKRALGNHKSTKIHNQTEEGGGSALLTRKEPETGLLMGPGVNFTHLFTWIEMHQCRVQTL